MTPATLEFLFDAGIRLIVGIAGILMATWFFSAFAALCDDVRAIRRTLEKEKDDDKTIGN